MPALSLDLCIWSVGGQAVSQGVCGENSILQKESFPGRLSEEDRDGFQAVAQPSLIASFLHLLLLYFASYLVLNIFGGYLFVQGLSTQGNF